MIERRIFIGLKVPEVVASEIIAWQERFKEWPVRWVRARDFHVTLVPPFLERDIGRAALKVDIVARDFSPVVIQLDQVSFGGGAGTPSFLWAEGRSTRDLASLREWLLGAFLQNAHRPFRQHVTLSRFRQGDYFSLPLKTLPETVEWTCESRSLSIYESLGGGRGYRILHSSPFSGRVFSPPESRPVVLHDSPKLIKVEP